MSHILESIYDALAVPFDPTSVGTVADASCPTDPERVRTALETTLVGDADAVTESVQTLIDVD